MTTVENIAKFVAPYIGCSYPNDKDRVFELLSLVESRIWNSGKFYGSTKWNYVTIREDRTIVTPHGYNVLLGCNVNFKPVTINGTYFLFHKNGPGDSVLNDRNFNKDIIDLGDSPTIYQPRELYCDPCCDGGVGDYFLSVVSTCCEFQKKTRVSCLNKKGQPIYTYFKKESDQACVCDDKEDEYGIQAINGIEYPLVNKHVNYPHILIGEILGIIKEPSISTVEYYLTDNCTKLGRLVASLGPYDITSTYKRYKVGKSCLLISNN